MEFQQERTIRTLDELRRSMVDADASTLEQVRASRHLELAARAAFVRCVQEARVAGHGWDCIAEHVASLPAVYGPEAGEKLFESVAVGGSSVGHHYLSWRCQDCEALVLDHGPYGGHPDDNQRGHADGCARRQAEVATHNARLCDDPEPELAAPSVSDVLRVNLVHRGLDLGDGLELG